MATDAVVQEIWAQLNREIEVVGYHEERVEDDRTRLMSRSSESVTRKRVQEEHERKLHAQAIGRFNDAVCAQLHQMWLVNGRPLIRDTDFLTGTRDPHQKCDNTCKPVLYQSHLYLVQSEDADDPPLPIDALRREKTARKMFVREQALHDAEQCGLIGPTQRRSHEDMEARRAAKAAKPRAHVDLCEFKCLLHVCVEDFCVLAVSATKRQTQLYNRMHARPVTSGAFDTHVYFCPAHARFHICDEFCDQVEPGRYNENICVLSARVKRSTDYEFALADGAGAGAREHNDGMNDGGGGGGEGMPADQDGESTMLADSANASTSVRPAARRRAAYGEVSIIRDRGDANRTGTPNGGVRRRGRGRGRGSIAAGSTERARIGRIRLYQSVIKSSGDDDAALISPQQAAAQFERLAAGDMARRSNQVDTTTNDGVAPAGKRSTSKRRKLGRARRFKTQLSGKAAQMTLNLPRAFLMGVPNAPLPTIKKEPVETVVVGQKREREDDDQDGPTVGEEEDDGPDVEPEEDHPEYASLPRITGIKNEQDHMMNQRLAVPVGAAYEMLESQRPEFVNTDDLSIISVSFSLRPKIPFAERTPGKYDEEFACDVVLEQNERAERLERFRLTGNITSNTFFSTVQLFEQYGERACAIIWRLMCSRERDAIERQKTIACATKTRSEIDAYMSTQKKLGQACYAERVERIARAAHDKAGLYKTIVLDEALWKIIETYNALLVIEFYFNLVSLPRRLPMHLSQETAATITTEFYFENFVPAILFFLCEGLEVNGVVILPRDTFVMREWWPQTATLRALGIADQTMTHLVSTIRAYIESARSSNVSMRRFEATTLDLDELAPLRVDEKLLAGADSHEAARRVARRVVELFIEKRARRLAALMHY